LNLFDCETIQRPGIELKLYRHWLSAHQGWAFFDEFQHGLQWQQSVIQLYGKCVPIPRLNAWYGDPDSHYSYSGIALDPQPWTPTLAELKRLVEASAGSAFNSVLVNLYRNGRDGVAWHSDDEPELGPTPVIASVSLGETRRFSLKQRKDKFPGVDVLQKFDVWLEHGSLLLMLGETQRYWCHQIPKTAKAVGPRINLTFRTILGGR
jgi:alkylated DNA repair dioxygenase AlkB